ncbi:MAG: hypothetical protein JW780_00300 [Clostridiales bacterium]|nr:hypothetical protein [Clostridiales bacterium]
MKKIIKNEEECSEVKRPKLYIFIGAYGSGKSEVSVHFARMLSQAYPERDITLVDLDTVNPYYRSADAKLLLQGEGIRVIAPVFANTNVDVPAIPAEVNAVFDNPKSIGVIDVGGEDLGAKVLAGLKKRIEGTDFRVFMVVNTFRPFTVDAKGIAKTAMKLSAAANLPIYGLIDNSNLLNETTGEELEISYPVLKEASEITGIPLRFASGLDEYLPKEWVGQTSNQVPLIRMKRSIFYNY